MKFSKALPILFDDFEKAGIDFSLIGGVALYFHGAARTTFDVDFLILLAQSDRVNDIMKKWGYTLLHRSGDAANYASENKEMGQVDFLFAHRKYALAMLQRAEKREIMGHRVKVLRSEDLIGLKVQSSSNDPQRASRDQSDIEDIIRRNAKTLDWELVAEYFKLFDREDELRDLKKRLS